MTRHPFDPRTELMEHCGQCVNGFDRDGEWCLACGGTTRRPRHTHDPRSAIDHEPEPNTAARFIARVVALAAKLPNDAELGMALRALLNEGRP